MESYGGFILTGGRSKTETVKYGVSSFRYFPERDVAAVGGTFATYSATYWAMSAPPSISLTSSSLPPTTATSHPPAPAPARWGARVRPPCLSSCRLLSGSLTADATRSRGRQI